jgi:hypothetical protein
VLSPSAPISLSAEEAGVDVSYLNPSSVQALMEVWGGEPSLLQVRSSYFSCYSIHQDTSTDTHTHTSMHMHTHTHTDTHTRMHTHTCTNHYLPRKYADCHL